MGLPGKPGAPASAPVFMAPLAMSMGGGQKGYYGDEPEAVTANFEFIRMYDGKLYGRIIQQMLYININK